MDKIFYNNLRSTAHVAFVLINEINKAMADAKVNDCEGIQFTNIVADLEYIIAYCATVYASAKQKDCSPR